VFAYRIFRPARSTDFANAARSLWRARHRAVYRRARYWIDSGVWFRRSGLPKVIERKQPLLHSEQVGNYMAPEAVSEIIDELVPPASRGRSINSMIESMGCAEGRIVEYENVWIARHSDICVPLKRERESTATVVFKRQLCPVSPYAQMHN
jgi:hypothetical protein